MKIKRIIGITSRVALVIAILSLIIFRYEELTNIDVRAIVDKADSLWGAGVAAVGVYGLKAIVFIIPASVLYMAVGMAFDFVPGLAVNAAGLFLELNLTYFIGRFLGGEVVEKKLLASKKGKKIIELRDKKTPYIFLARLLPVVPIDFVSLFFGASNMNYIRYILVSFFGVMPRIILITHLGDKIYELIPIDFMMTVVIFAVLGASIFMTVKYIRKKK